MSGYVEVKLPSASTRGFTTWKTWKKQWCILRPNSVKNGILIVLHTSVGTSSTSQIEIPKGSVVYRTHSKTKDYAFGIYPSIDSQRSLILLSSQSESECQSWMSRIRAMLSGKDRIDLNHQSNYLNISIIDNDFSNNCGFKGLHGKVRINSDNIEIFDTDDQRIVYFNFYDINDIELVCNSHKTIDKQRIFIVKTNSNFLHGQGQLFFFSITAKTIVDILKNKHPKSSPNIVFRKLDRRISRSEGTLFTMTDFREKSSDSERDSGLSSCDGASTKSNSQWYYPNYPLTDPSLRLSINDDGVVLKGQFASTLVAAGILLSSPNQKQNLHDRNISSEESNKPKYSFHPSLVSNNQRISEASISSGFYEEISEQTHANKKPHINQLNPDNTYEPLFESIYGTTRRYSKKGIPPPLPPRKIIDSERYDRTSDSGLDEESSYSFHKTNRKRCSIHSSIGSLNSLPQLMLDMDSIRKDPKTHAKFNFTLDAFRKRIQSDSQHSKTKYLEKNLSCKCDTMSMHSGRSHISQKKLFDFNVTPSKSINILRNSKMAKAFRKFGKNNQFDNLRNAAKSCETLDIQNINEISISKRSSKSEDKLDLQSIDFSNDQLVNDIDLSSKWYADRSDDDIKDLSLICAENNLKNSYPEDILELILQGKTKQVEQKLKQRAAEEQYVIMSPNGITNENISKTCDIITENNYVVMKGGV